MKQKLHTHLEQLERSATLAINERSAEMAATGQTIYRFGFGQSPFPVPDSIVAALQKNAYRKNYLPVEGLFELRKSIAEYHRETDQIDICADGVLIAPGSKELMFTLQLALEGSTLTPSPCWVSYAPQGHIVKRQTHHIKTSFKDNWRLRPDQLESAVKNIDGPHLLILNYPGNPDGGTYTINELIALAKVARDNNILILSDEIYGRLHHKGEHISIARYYPEGTIVSSGLSKWCGAGGWRLGHFAFPKELYWLKGAMASIASETYSCVTTPVQYAAVTAYTDHDAVDDFLFHSRRILETIGHYCSDALSNANVNVNPPTGAFYLYLDFENYRPDLAGRGMTNSKIFCEQLLQETGVALLPGSAFGRSAEELNARLAYVNFDGSEALKISKLLSASSTLTMKDLGKNIDNIKAGIEKLIDWLKE